MDPWSSRVRPIRSGWSTISGSATSPICGIAGPDEGKGGKFLFLPPGLKDRRRGATYIFKSPTYNNTCAQPRLSGKLETPKPGVDNLRQRPSHLSVDGSRSPPVTNFINVSGKAFNTIHSLDALVFRRGERVVRKSLPSAMDPETLGLLASIGIMKGVAFTPDDRMKKILAEAAAVGRRRRVRWPTGAAQRGTVFYPDSAWEHRIRRRQLRVPHHGARLLDARSFSSSTPPASRRRWPLQMVGARFGSTRAAFVDSKERPFDGGKTYKLHLPAGIPAKEFWSLVAVRHADALDAADRPAVPEHRQPDEGRGRQSRHSVDVYFGPKAPQATKATGCRPGPERAGTSSCGSMAPSQPWFDKTWRPGEVELME